LEVQTSPGQVLSNWTIRMKHGLQRHYAPALWESNGWTVVYRKNESVSASGWVTFLFETSFAYNGTDPLMIDFSFNNATYSLAGLCRFTETPDKRAVFFQTDSAFGDPLAWNGSDPPPLVTNQLPNLRLTMEQPVLMTPAGAVQVVKGTWSGQLQVHQPGTNVFLRASDDSGHIAEGNEFAVESNSDGNRNGLPDAWERHYFGAVGTEQSRAQNDPDGDGLTNSEEFRSGTNPMDAASVVRIAAVWNDPAGLVVSFGTVAGKAYQLERALSLARPGWSIVAETIAGTGALVQVRDSAVPVEGSCFYRVRVVP
jgi:hypothetical protein